MVEIEDTTVGRQESVISLSQEQVDKIMNLFEGEGTLSINEEAGKLILVIK